MNESTDHKTITPRTRITVFSNTTLYTVLSLVICGGIGFLIDSLLETSPAFFIGSLVIGYPASLFIVYKRIKSLAPSL